MHEVKFDGYRMQARLDHGEVRLLTRKALNWLEKFPNVAEAVAELPADTALIDGEIVVENERGIANFSLLQADLRDDRSDRFVYYVFDLLHRDGRDLSALPLVERKAELEDLVGKDRTGVIRYSEHFAEDGSAMLRSACSLGLEGIVSKRRDAPYRSGRSDTFLKIKCAIEQELVVGGYAPSNVMRNAIGALVVGYYENGRLHLCGSGRHRLHAGNRQGLMEAAASTRNRQAAVRRHPARGAPRRALGQARDGDRGKSERGLDRRQRGAAGSFQRRAGGQACTRGRARGCRHGEDEHQEERRKSAAVAGQAGGSQTKSRAPPSQAGHRQRQVGRRQTQVKDTNGGVRFTHPDRVYWDDAGITKQNLADYYRATWDWMAPHVVNRPLSFLRCPDGTKANASFRSMPRPA